MISMFGRKMNAHNWPADWQKLKKDFGAIFHMSMVDIYDPLTSWYFEAFKINILAFDDATCSTLCRLITASINPSPAPLP